MTVLTTKALSRVEVKDAAKGIVTAAFSTFGVIDSDGDVTSKSSFRDGAPVVVSAYGHTSWNGDLPIGKGSITTTDTEAIADLQFFMDTPHGSAAFNTIKELGPLQEWSYSLEDTVRKAGDLNGIACMFIESTTVKEVSPVLRGASINTRTIDAKARRKQLASEVEDLLAEAGTTRWGTTAVDVEVEDYDQDAGYAIFEFRPIVNGWPSYDEGELVQVDYMIANGVVTLGATETPVEEVTTYAPKTAAAGAHKFSEQADIALCGVRQLVETAKERLALRANTGKPIDEQINAYDRLAAELEPLKSAIANATPPDHADELQRIWLNLVATSQGAST